MTAAMRVTIANAVDDIRAAAWVLREARDRLDSIDVTKGGDVALDAARHASDEMRKALILLGLAHG